MPDAPAMALFAVAAMALIVTPGPAVLYVVARSLDQGRSAGIVSAVGVGIGSLVHVAAAVLGLSALLASSALAFSLVKYAGAGYLIYLGLRKLLSREETARVAATPQSLGRIFTQGVLVNLLNPKVALFFLAFLPQFVSAGRGPVAIQVAALGLLFVAMALVSDSLYAVAAGAAGGYLRRSTGLLHVQRYLTGGVYIALGVAAAASGGEAK